MIRSATAPHRMRMTIAIVLMAMSGVLAAAQPPARMESSTNLSAGNIGDLRRLLDGHQLTGLRMTRNGDYSASLLFQTEKLSYYISLSRADEFLRVIQTDSYADAENTYRNFAAQTEQLAQVDIDTMRLQAGKKYSEQLVAINEQRLQNLQHDADQQRQQAQQVAALQQQAQQQAVSLSSDLHATNKQLDAVQQSIRALEAEQANPRLALPPSSPPPPATATAPQQ